jgi:RNA polymerase sigma factor (sigma-70 family)
MKITAITRYKHGGLYAALESLKWTQKELAERSGITQSAIGLLINLRIKPSIYYVQKIQNALAEAGYYLDVLEQWPETFHGLKAGFNLVQTADIELENLLDCKEAFMLPAPECEDTEELDNAIENVLDSLTPREKSVIKSRFWDKKTLETTGNDLGITRERIRQIEAKALRKLKHPDRLEMITRYLPDSRVQHA